MSDFKNSITGEILSVQKYKLTIKNDKVIPVTDDGIALIDEQGNPYEDITEFRGFCTNFNKFSSLSSDQKKEVLLKRSKDKSIPEVRRMQEEKRAIDSAPILSGKMAQIEKDFKVKKKTFTLNKK